MAHLDCQVESTPVATVIRLAGELAAGTTPGIWACATRRMAETACPLVLDVSDLKVVDTQAVTVFAALARRISLWPGVSTLLCGAPGPLATLLRQESVDTLITLCDTRDEAMLLAGGLPHAERLRRPLAPVVGAARRGRDITTEACLRWDLGDLVPRACVVASELITNAVRHTGEPFELDLARTLHYLHIAVYDRSAHPAVRRDGDPMALTGRGLLVIERSTLAWGSTRTSTGKAVWATMSAGGLPRPYPQASGDRPA